MGICDSLLHGKKITYFNQKEQFGSENFNNNNNNEEENLNNNETLPNLESQIDNKSSTLVEIGNNKSPELAKYNDQSFLCGKKSENTQINNNTHSIFSSGLTEEEVIIRGEINKNCKNKEEDFDNNSFKKLVKKNGGLIIKKKDKNKLFNSCKEINPIFDFNRENISEMKSKHSFPFMQNKENEISHSLGNSWSTSNIFKSNISENNKNIINYNINNIQYLSDSIKINGSILENCQTLTVPNTDEPLPDIDELSTESRFILERNS